MAMAVPDRVSTRLGAELRLSSPSAQLRLYIARSGLSVRAAAKRLGINDRTLRRMLDGALKISTDDPIIGRARRL